jgi:hypothetical protein
MQRLLKHQTTIEWLRNGLFLALILTGTVVAVGRLWSPHARPAAAASHPARESVEGMDSVVAAVDAAFKEGWTHRGLEPAPVAPELALARRLSLALTGTLPSLQEIRAFEAQPGEDRFQWWISRLLADRRSSDYLAERFARAYVGVEDGPFFVFRRRRLVDWLSDALHSNRPYDQIARDLIDSKGVWTTHPEVNFVTATIEPEKGPDRGKLAARVSRAFLGVRIDCVECHDGKLGSTWKQRDFHQLAAFFGQTEMSLAGLQDNSKKHYEYRFLRKTAAEPVQPMVPWAPELMPDQGGPRERLASWITAPGNRPFARAIVNRVWALLFNRPLVTPVDDIPMEGPYPPGLEILADDFTAHGGDLRRLIRVITATRVFQLDSQSPNSEQPPTEASEQQWASFPMTRLRPEQMAGSIIQASSLTTIDAETHVLYRMKRIFDTGDFLKRYGDLGEDEFGSQNGTIPQRLLMMNGAIVEGHLKSNPILNASSRIGMLAPDDATAIETAYLAIFTRRPTPEEAGYFTGKLAASPGKQRGEAMADLYWTLMNSTEFSWNH